MGRNYGLAYPKKATTKKVLEETTPAKLEEVRKFRKHERLVTDDWVNMLVFGDNLGVLKSFMSDLQIKGKVDLIYIDPPFSTKQEFRAGKERVATISSGLEDEIAYEDILTGADFLEFIRKRLIFLRELLSDQGSIYLHIDSKKGHYIKILMDEVFGEEHFINDITRIKCNPKNFERQGYGNIKDMILFYSKTDNYIWNESAEEYTAEDIKELFKKVDEKGRRYTTTPLHAPGETKSGVTGREWKGMKPPKGRHWRYSPKELTRLDEARLIEWSKSGNPRKIIYADEQRKKKKKRQDIWRFKDRQNPSYPTEKNLEMLEVIISASSNPGSIVLDCFVGSGTTLVAAEKLQRKWIGIDNSPNAIATILNRFAKMRNHFDFVFYNASGKPLPKTLEKFTKRSPSNEYRL